MYYRHYIIEDTGKEVQKYYIVDDTNVSGASLAKRRLALYKQGIRLKTLGKAVFFLGDLVKLATSKMWFIDSLGTVFQYKKHTKTKLIFKKIKHRHLIPSGGAILELEGISTRFKCLFAPRPHEVWAGVLQVGMQWVLYGVYQEQHKDTWRMV